MVFKRSKNVFFALASERSFFKILNKNYKNDKNILKSHSNEIVKKINEKTCIELLNEIKEIIPHRYPMLLIDRVVEMDIEDKLFANFLKEDEINKWENFYDSIVQTREAKNLKVAYLSGPNPENDLREMFKHGILPENVWAFESDNKVYNNAIMSALNSEFPFIKIINGSIDITPLTNNLKSQLAYCTFGCLKKLATF